MLTAFFAVVTLLAVFVAGYRVGGNTRGLRGTVALLFFVFNPIILPRLLSGFQGPALWVTSSVLVFLVGWLTIEHWSTFMRSIVLGLLFALVLWSDERCGIWLAVAFVPWAACNRRPSAAIGMLLALLLIGAGLYKILFQHVPPAIAAARTVEPVEAVELLRPLMFVWVFPGLWVMIRQLIEMVRERRSMLIHYVGVLACVTFGMVLWERRQAAPVAWAPMVLFSLWAVLIARRLPVGD